MDVDNVNFSRQVGVGVSGKVLSTVVSFGGSIVVARVLGPESFGVYFFLMAVVSLLDNPVSGWAIACRKRYTEAGSTKGELIGAMILFGVGATVLAFVIGMSLQFTGVVPNGTLLGFLFIGTSSFMIASNMIMSTEHFGQNTWMVALRDLLRVAGQVGFVLLGFGVEGMIGGLVAANLLMLPVSLRYVETARIPSTAILFSVWEFAKSSIPQSILGYGRGRLPILLLGMVAASSVVGRFQVVINITLPMLFMTDAITGGLVGHISNMYTKGQEIRTNVENALSFTSLVALPMVLGIATVGDRVLVTVYSSQYETGILFITLVAVAKLFRTQSSVMESTLLGINKPDVNLKITTVVVATLLLVGTWSYLLIGVIGIVVGIVFSEAVGYVLPAIYLKREIDGLSIIPKTLIQELVSAVVMWGAVVGMKSVLTLTIPNLVLVIGTGVVVYFTVLTVISHQFRQTIILSTPLEKSGVLFGK